MSLTATIGAVITTVAALYIYSRVALIVNLMEWINTTPKPYGRKRTDAHLQVVGVFIILITVNAVTVVLGLIFVIQSVLEVSDPIWQAFFLSSAVSLALILHGEDIWHTPYELLQRKYFAQVNAATEEY